MTTSARTSWNLPPEDLLDAAYIPSLWAVQKTVLMVLLGVVLGPLSLASILTAQPTVHRHLANVRIPTHRGHLLRFDRGQATDLMAATIPI